MKPVQPRSIPPERRRQNLRLALILASVAATLFLGFIFKWKFL
ncbi:MAG: cytochrome oxidase small assembly protein [Thiomonas delicata]